MSLGRRWEDDVTVKFKERGCDGVYCMAQDYIHW